VACNRCNGTFDREGAHSNAWDPTVVSEGFEKIKNGMFLIVRAFAAGGRQLALRKCVGILIWPFDICDFLPVFP
jgi:hypothetical protein